jgi:hypothetical protein
MDRDSLTALAENIGVNGLMHPIVLYGRQIVDGRNRLLACNAAKIEPRFVNWRDIYKGPMTLSQWVWSINIARRHLTLDQITAVRTALNALEEREAARQRQAEARRQQGEHGKEGGRGKRKPSMANPPSRVFDGDGKSGESHSRSEHPPQPKAPTSNCGSVRKKLANDIGSSEHKVRQAMNIQGADPELLTQVAHGTITLRAAEKKVKSKSQSKGQEPAKRKEYDLEQAVTRAVRAVEKVLESCPEDKHDTLLAEVIKTLEKLR